LWEKPFYIKTTCLEDGKDVTVEKWIGIFNTDSFILGKGFKSYYRSLNTGGFQNNRYDIQSRVTLVGDSPLGCRLGKLFDDVAVVV